MKSCSCLEPSRNCENSEYSFAEPRSDFERARDKLFVLTLKPEDFDSRGDIRFPCRNGDEQWRGGLKYYQPDWDWVRVGFKCLGLYDDGNDDWLAMDGNAREWAVGFHGSSNQGTENIAKTRLFQKGKGQAYESSKDANTLNDSCGKVCGKGVYFGDRINIAEWYRSQAEPSDELVCVLQVKQFTACITSKFVQIKTVFRFE